MDRMRDLPRPYPDPVLYKENLDMGFKTYPLRHENYQKYQAAQRGEKADYFPIRLDIENVSRCNYRCTMCQVSDWPGRKRADDMPYEDYTRLIDSQYGLIEVKIQGMGEPLMGECFPDMVQYARNRHIWVRSTTNASLLHLKDNYMRVIDADICELQVSVDGVTAETYKKIRRGGNLSRVIENCKKLNRYSREVGRQRTRMWVVLQEANFHEVRGFAPLAGALGFTRLSIALDLNDWGQEKWRAVNDPVDIHRQFGLELAEELIAQGKDIGVEVTFWFIDEKYSTTTTSKLCPWPFERAYISSDMRVVPCCMISNPDVLDIGDARNLETEWNADGFVAFRRRHLNGDIPPVCRSCYENKST